MQIKILQILPLLLQNYGSSLEGDLIAGVLQTCGLLQQIKTPAVANIAAATFQQVVIFVFEKVETEDGMRSQFGKLCHTDTVKRRR